MEDFVEEKMPMREGYREKLRQTFSGYLKGRVEGEPKKILSVGCGFGFEAEPLLKVFPKAKFKGIDNDERIIRAAIRTNEDLTGVEFQVEDARKIEAFGTEPYDIIVVRHPQVLGEIEYGDNLAQDWYKILQNSMEALKPGGIFFVSTTDEDHEGGRVLDCIGHSKEKMTIIINDRNKFFYGSWPFKDNFIIVAKKTGEQKNTTME